MNDSANLTLWLELILVAVSTGSYLYWFSQKETPAVRFIARYSYYGFTLFSTIASAVLMMYFLNHNFNLQYVAEYSSRDLELHYLISSFWAGQEGSFLLWILLSAWLGIIVLRKAGDMEPQVMFFYNLSNLFLSILLINQTPFKLLPETPIDGNGLNMLLQDPWMVIHPPASLFGLCCVYGSVRVCAGRVLAQRIRSLGHEIHFLGGFRLRHPRSGNYYRRLLGVQSTRLGWILGLGSRGKCIAAALAHRNCIDARHAFSVPARAFAENEFYFGGGFIFTHHL